MSEQAIIIIIFITIPFIIFITRILCFFTKRDGENDFKYYTKLTLKSSVDTFLLNLFIIFSISTTNLLSAKLYDKVLHWALYLPILEILLGVIRPILTRKLEQALDDADESKLISKIERIPLLGKLIKASFDKLMKKSAPPVTNISINGYACNSEPLVKTISTQASSDIKEINETQQVTLVDIDNQNNIPTA